MIATFVICLAMFAADEEKPAPPPPLTAEQLTQVRDLVQRAQTEQSAARQALTEAQEDLARCYAKYELDEKEVTRLQSEIIAQQQKLLESHHQMQKELRTIVGAERFLVLSRRIENALRSPPANAPAPTAPSNKK